MRSLFLILLDKNFQREEITKFFDEDSRFGKWFFSFENSVFVYSSLSADKMHDVFVNHWKHHFRHFITEIDDSKIQGWMSRRHWEIIYNKGAEERFDLKFSGYYVDLDSLPEGSGVVCVYDCDRDDKQKTVDIRSLVSIEPRMTSDNACSLKEREKLWQGQVTGAICYSIASVEEEKVQRCVQALRVEMKMSTSGAVSNVDNLNVYIKTMGKNALLEEEIRIDV